MVQKRYAKVIVPTGPHSIENYRQALAGLAHPRVDVGLLQVGVHEAILRPHLALHLQARTGRPLEQLLKECGALRVEMITEEDAQALSRQRIAEDLQPKPVAAIPAAEGGHRWHLRSINVEAAWDAVGGPDAIDWGDIRIGQIDTGYTRHIAFGHAEGDDSGSWMLADASRTIMYPDVPPEYGMLPPPEPGSGIDPMPFGALNAGHGTRIGATISGHCRMDDGGMFHGVAPRVPHVMVRITDSVAINTRQNEFVAALGYLVDVARVDVVNVSLGIFPPIASKAIRNAMAHARSRGVIVVCAAGNHVDPVVMPAALDTAIAVGGVTRADVPWEGSSFGPEVDFSAPADEIHRPLVRRDGIGRQFAGGGDGTSYATAMTTGSAALWLLRWRTQVAQKYGRTARRVDAFRQAVQATCRQTEEWEPQPFGAGILDAGRLCGDEQAALPG